MIPPNAPDRDNFIRYFTEKFGTTDYREFEYKDSNGNPSLYVFRFNLPEGGKEIRPCTLWRDAKSGNLEWQSKWPPPPLSLYHLEQIAKQPELPILLLEGEGKADVAARLLGSAYLVIGLPGGAKAVNKVDFTPLKGRRVICWPDHDGPGFHAMIQAAQAIGGDVPIIMPDPDWAPGYDVADLIDEGWNGDQLSEFIGLRSVSAAEFESHALERFPKTGHQDADDGNGDDNEATEGRPKQADILIGLARENAELFNFDDQAFASFTLTDHLETYPVRSKGFRDALLKLFLDACQTAPNSEAMTTALNTLDAICRFQAGKRKVALRVGGEGDKLYLDLCNDPWQIIEIDKDGWRLVEASACPIRFRRTRGMRPLPAPITGGSIKDLRRFINVSDTDFILVVAWLIACFRDRGPYPVLIFGGQHGSGKSNIARMLRNLIDPNLSPLRSSPREERDLMIAATNGWACIFDNLSFIPQWLSDALCRLASGGGLALRALYSDNDEIILDAQRPCMLIGIEDLATRGDLLDRSILVNPSPISDLERRTEQYLRAEFETAQPALLGALLDAVSTALLNVDTVQLERLPRMADFVVWVTAAEPALGWKPGEFISAYNLNRESTHEIVLENSLIAPVLAQVIEREFESLKKGITATSLLELLNKAADDKTRFAKTWPKTPAALSNALKRIAPHLLHSGIGLVFDRTGPARLIIFERITADNAGKSSSQPSQPSSMTMNDDGMTMNGHTHRHAKNPNDFNGLTHNFGPHDDGDEENPTLSGDDDVEEF